MTVRQPLHSPWLMKAVMESRHSAVSLKVWIRETSCTLVQYIEYYLWLRGSSLTVGEVEDYMTIQLQPSQPTPVPRFLVSPTEAALLSFVSATEAIPRPLISIWRAITSARPQRLWTLSLHPHPPQTLSQRLCLSQSLPQCLSLSLCQLPCQSWSHLPPWNFFILCLSCLAC